MAYKWKPSASQRRAFAEKMQDPAKAAAYAARKSAKANKRRAGSAFNYEKAGGKYIPTQAQHNEAFRALTEDNLSPAQEEACNLVMSAFALNENVHHDHIHIVNEIMRERMRKQSYEQI